MKKVTILILCLFFLMGCTSTRQIVKTEYIKQQAPPLPVEPEYYSVDFKNIQGNYCLDPENAKNLLKNRELDKGYQEEMREILQGLQNIK